MFFGQFTITLHMYVIPPPTMFGENTLLPWGRCYSADFFAKMCKMVVAMITHRAIVGGFFACQTDHPWEDKG